MRFSEGSTEEGHEVWVYSHWLGDDDVNRSPLAEKVRTAIARRERWGDESYLARIIVSEIIRDDIDDETGFGIAPNGHYSDEEFSTIEVDLAEETVNGIGFDRFVHLYDADDERLPEKIADDSSIAK